MRVKRLWALAAHDLRRSRNHFLLASIGIIVGIAAFTFFLSLGLGVRAIVLGKIFPLDKLEVAPRGLEVDVGPLRMGMGADRLDDAVVEKLGGIENVSRVFPKMKLTVPSMARGGKELFGNDLRSEIVADGIEPDLVAEDIARGHHFKDFEAEGLDTSESCTEDEACGDERYCHKEPDAEGKTPDEGFCRHYLPIIASHHLVEMYNGVLRRAHDFPQLNPDFVIGFTFEFRFGASMVKASRRDKITRHRAQLVGFSDKAISLGATMPIGYVRRLNVEYGTPEAATEYHSAVLEVASKDDVAQVAKDVEEMNLEVLDSGAEQAAVLIAVFMLVFGLVSVVIVGIAAVNIMHVFFMLVYERQREIGIFRAVGATRGDIRTIILLQSVTVGCLAGLGGIAVAVGAGMAFDAVSASWIPDFPYKPTTYFDFQPLLLAASLVFSIGFCVFGSALPARRAARIDPARVLAGQ